MCVCKDLHISKSYRAIDLKFCPTVSRVPGIICTTIFFQVVDQKLYYSRKHYLYFNLLKIRRTGGFALRLTERLIYPPESRSRSFQKKILFVFQLTRNNVLIRFNKLLTNTLQSRLPGYTSWKIEAMNFA